MYTHGTTGMDGKPVGTETFAGARIRELEGALHEARLQLEYLNEKFPATGTTSAVLARISMALAGSATYEAELRDREET